MEINKIVFTDGSQEREINIKELAKAIKRSGGNITKKFRLSDAEGSFISNTIVVPVKERIIISESSMRQTQIEYLCILNGEVCEERIICDISCMDKVLLEKIEQSLGTDFVYSRKSTHLKLFVKLIKNLTKFIKKVHVYEYLGWNNIGKKYGYFDGVKLISDSQEISEIACEGSSELKEFCIESVEASKEECFEFVQNMLKVGPKRVTIPFLSFALLSLVSTPLKEVGDDVRFMLWVVGPTGSRKTTLCKLFFNFSRRNTSAVFSSFKDTSSRMQKSMNLSRDSAIFFDDYHPPVTHSEKKARDEKFSFLVRSSSDGSYKGRMTSEMKVMKAMPQNGIAAVTAEDYPDGHSSTARLFMLNLSKGDINLGKLDYCQKNLNLYSTFINDFIIWFSSKYEDISNQLHHEFIDMRNKMNTEDIHGRVNEQCIHIKLGMKLFAWYSLDNGLIDLTDVEKISRKLEKFLISYMVEMKHLLSARKASVMYLNTLLELVATGKCRLAKYRCKDRGLKIGWISEEKIYLVAGVAYAEVQQYWKMQGQLFPKTMTELHRELADEGLIIPMKDGTGNDYTQKVNVHGDSKDRVRVLVLERSVVMKYLDKELGGDEYFDDESNQVNSVNYSDEYESPNSGSLLDYINLEKESTDDLCEDFQNNIQLNEIVDECFDRVIDWEIPKNNDLHKDKIVNDAEVDCAKNGKVRIAKSNLFPAKDIMENNGKQILSIGGHCENQIHGSEYEERTESGHARIKSLSASQKIQMNRSKKRQ